MAARKKAAAKQTGRKKATRAKATKKKVSHIGPGRPKTARGVKNQEAGVPVEIDLDQYMRLMAIHCTDDEAAGILEISPKTIQRRREKDEAFRAAELLARARGRASLKRVMWALALQAASPGAPRAAATMAIFLSKQSVEKGGLGFTDRQITDITFSPSELEDARQDLSMKIDMLPIAGDAA